MRSLLIFLCALPLLLLAGAPASGSAYDQLREYDKANNRTKKTSAGVITDYVFNHRLNQLDSYTDGTTTTSFDYDEADNRTERKIGGVLDTTYSYDHDNRLITLADATNSKTYSYAYDHRTRRVLRDESAAGGDEIKLSFIGGTSAMELDGAATAATFIRGSDYGGGVGGMLYSPRGTPAVPSYAHSNHRGDIVARTDTNGDITWQAAYEAYGTRPQDSAPGFGTNQDRQRGNTKDEDPTGLLNDGFRYRDLEAGVFITRDPAGFVDGPNVYTYARQNPWSSFDPLGLAKRLIGKNFSKEEIGQKVAALEKRRQDLIQERKKRTLFEKIKRGPHGDDDEMILITASAKSLRAMAEAELKAEAIAEYEALRTELEADLKEEGVSGVGKNSRFRQAADLASEFLGYSVEATLGGTNPVIQGLGGKGRGGKIWSSTKGKTSVRNAFGHWKKHKGDFSKFKNSLEYVRGVRKFIKSPPKGTLTKTRPKTGEKVMYHPGSNTFAIVRKDGVPRTMFKPDPKKHGYKTNLDYYHAQ